MNNSRDIPSDPKDQLTLNLLATLKNSIDRLNRHVGLSPEKTVQFDSQCQKHQQTDVDQLAETTSAHDQPCISTCPGTQGVPQAPQIFIDGEKLPVSKTTIPADVISTSIQTSLDPWWNTTESR